MSWIAERPWRPERAKLGLKWLGKWQHTRIETLGVTVLWREFESYNGQRIRRTYVVQTKDGSIVCTPQRFVQVMTPASTCSA